MYHCSSPIHRIPACEYFWLPALHRIENLWKSASSPLSRDLSAQMHIGSLDSRTVLSTQVLGKWQHFIHLYSVMSNWSPKHKIRCQCAEISLWLSIANEKCKLPLLVNHFRQFSFFVCLVHHPRPCSIADLWNRSSKPARFEEIAGLTWLTAPRPFRKHQRFHQMDIR